MFAFDDSMLDARVFVVYNTMQQHIELLRMRDETHVGFGPFLTDDINILRITYVATERDSTTVPVVYFTLFDIGHNIANVVPVGYYAASSDAAMIVRQTHLVWYLSACGNVRVD